MKHRRLISLAAAGAVAVSIAACGGGSGTEREGETAAPPEVAPNGRPLPAIPLTGVVTGEQRARTGIEGRQACQSPLASDYMRGISRSGRAQLMAGYLTDFASLVSWGEEFQGGRTEPVEGQPAAGMPVELHAVCWYRGDFFIVPEVDGGPAQQGRFAVLDVDVANSVVTVMGMSPKPMGVFAPRPPSPAALGSERAQEVAYGQPAGVTVK